MNYFVVREQNFLKREMYVLRATCLKQASLNANSNIILNIQLTVIVNFVLEVTVELKILLNVMPIGDWLTLHCQDVHIDE